MSTLKKNSSVLGLNSAADVRIKRSRTLAPFSPFMRYMCANRIVLQSYVYEVLNDTDLALLSLTCKLLLSSVVEYYELQASDEGMASSAPQNRKRRICVSDCLSTLELQRFYAMSVQNFLVRIDIHQPLEGLSMFSCDAGRRLCTAAVEMNDLLQIRAKVWSVATGPLVDALVLRFGYRRRFYHVGPRLTDVDQLMLFLRPAFRFPTAALNGSDYKNFKYDSQYDSYHTWYIKWHSETKTRKARLNYVRMFIWNDVDHNLLKYNLPWASIAYNENNVCALLGTAHDT
ncbi:hypothetical protein CYMTET_9299 [Cymbomonas tetramitiformis]|uniref:Uncharacterized protein n=1 Tax=Cymbomonas tetramitiformis TaxID=36881 RepID=A0AAE0GRY8_9CHLO|nr:hypothetical protein CYMTET_9299 [Cymbomonas tetramitiformis]